MTSYSIDAYYFQTLDWINDRRSVLRLFKRVFIYAAIPQWHKFFRYYFGKFLLSIRNQATTVSQVAEAYTFRGEETILHLRRFS